MPGRRAPAHWPGPRAARIPSAAHSLGGCSRRAPDGEAAEDTPSLCMQMARELQPIVTGSSVKDSSSRGGGGQKDEGVPRHGHGFPSWTWVKSRPHLRSQSGDLPLKTATRRHPVGLRGTCPPSSLLAARVRTQVHRLRA